MMLILVLNPFIIEFKHKEKSSTVQISIRRQLNLAQETVVNKNKNLDLDLYGILSRQTFRLITVYSLKAC